MTTAFRARRLPKHRGPAAWSAILPPRRPATPLEGTQTANVTVIGGGFAGLSAARRLHQLVPEARIALLDAHGIGSGAAGRNSGFMIDLPHELTSEDYAGSGDDRTVIALNRAAQAFASDAVDDYAINPAYFDRAGKINGAASSAAHAHNLSYAAHLESLGEGSEMLDAQAMAEITGSHHYLSGLYTPGTVMLQPAGYVQAFADGLRRDGIALFENSPVTSFSRDGSGWIVRTGSGTIRTEKIILTVNGHLESFGVAKGHLMQLFLFATMTPELDADALRKLGGQSRWGITPSDPMGTTLRRIDTAQGGNRIITRTCAVLRSGMETRATDFARAALTMQKKFDSRFPQLAGMKMEHTWAGHLCLTMNGVSHMREIENGVFTGCVQNGLGTARGTLTGMGAAELACGVTSAITEHFTAEPQAKSLPPRPVRDIGANTVLRWKEWKARDD